MKTMTSVLVILLFVKLLFSKRIFFFSNLAQFHDSDLINYSRSLLRSALRFPKHFYCRVNVIKFLFIQIFYFTL